MTADMVRNTHRFHGFGFTRWLYLFYGHEESKTTTKSDRNEQIEIQIRFKTARDSYDICYAGWYGLVQDLQLM
jgi:hypothetical protein